MADVPSLSKRFPTTSRHFLKGLGAIAIGIGALYAIVSLLALTINWADSALHPFREHEAKYEQICRQVIAEADTLSGDETIPEKGLIIVDGMSGEVSSRVTGDSLGNRAPDRARSPERVRFIACRWEHPIQIGDYGAACPALRVSMSYDLVDLRTGNVLDEKRFEGTRPIDAIPAPLNPSKCRQYGRGLPESGPIVDWLQEAMANR
jgi:hypothetical protein